MAFFPQSLFLFIAFSCFVVSWFIIRCAHDNKSNRRGKHYVIMFVLLYIVIVISFSYSYYRTIRFLLKFGGLTAAKFSPERCGKKQSVPTIMWWLSMGAPCAVFCTFCLVTYQCYRHLKTRKRRGEGITQLHARAMQVLLLPTVYSSMALDSLLLVWDAFAGNVEDHPSWKCPWMDYVDAGFHAAMDTADLYEAWALQMFGSLVLHRVAYVVREGRQAIHNFEPGEEMKITCDEDGCVKTVIANGPASTRGIKEGDLIVNVCAEPYSQDTLQRAEESGTSYQVTVRPYTKDIGSMRTLALQGVQSFVIMTFFYAIYTGFARLYLKFSGDKGSADMKKFEHYLFGAGFIASCTAIVNIVTIERVYHEELAIKNFRAALKFWSVKILVSIAFMQSSILNFFQTFHFLQSITELHQRLLYSSFLCYELLAIAFLMAKAWPFDDQWLGDAEADAKEGRTLWAWIRRVPSRPSPERVELRGSAGSV